MLLWGGNRLRIKLSSATVKSLSRNQEEGEMDQTNLKDINTIDKIQYDSI
jgi:hypothetical protein